MPHADPRLMTAISELRASRELFANLTLRELRGKYKRSVLGWLWSMLNPLATMAIFALVFRFFLKVPVPEGDPSGMHTFAFFLLCGLLPYNFLSASLTGGMLALVGNSSLVQKVWFPRELLVAANTGAAVVGLLIELGVLSVVLLIAGNMVIPWLVPMLGIVVLQACFVVGLALIASIVNVYFRDLEHLVAIALQVWFYATPIIYPETVVADALADRPLLYDLYQLNPLVGFVDVYRSFLYDLTFPDATTVLYLAAVSVASLLIGFALFGRFVGRLAEEL
jgi:ABC-2 type transport system permease protein